MTSKFDLVSFFRHVSRPLKSREFLAWMMICFSSPVISSNSDAKSSAFVSNSSVIDGYKSTTSNSIKAWEGLLGMCLCQLITASLFFHCITVVASTTLLLMRSRILLLMMPISDLAGLSKRVVGLFAKFGLWSFSVIKHCFSASASIRLSNFRHFAIFFSSLTILVTLVAGAFLYVFVMLVL